MLCFSFLSIVRDLLLYSISFELIDLFNHLRVLSLYDYRRLFQLIDFYSGNRVVFLFLFQLVDLLLILGLGVSVRFGLFFSLGELLLRLRRGLNWVVYNGLSLGLFGDHLNGLLLLDHNNRLGRV